MKRILRSPLIPSDKVRITISIPISGRFTIIPVVPAILPPVVIGEQIRSEMFQAGIIRIVPTPERTIPGLQVQEEVLSGALGHHLDDPGTGISIFSIERTGK